MPPKKKKISGYIKLQIQAGAATPAPPVGPALGQHGVNIMEFVKAYNAAVSAGWSADELRKIGFPEPDKKARAKRRAARKPATSSAPAAPAPEPVEVPADAQHLDA